MVGVGVIPSKNAKDDVSNEMDELKAKIKAVYGEIREKAKEFVANKGYYPYVRKKKGRLYMTIRKGDHEIHLGPYDEEYFNELKSLLPPSGRMPGGRTVETVVGGDGGGVSADVGPKIGRPKVPTEDEWRLWAVRFGIRSSVILYYEHATQRGYTGSLADFINDVVELYFSEHGRHLAIVDRRALEQAKRLGLEVIGA